MLLEQVLLEQVLLEQVLLEQVRQRVRQRVYLLDHRLQYHVRLCSPS